jgi:hypothetical protein
MSKPFAYTLSSTKIYAPQKIPLPNLLICSKLQNTKNKTAFSRCKNGFRSQQKRLSLAAKAVFVTTNLRDCF